MELRCLQYGIPPPRGGAEGPADIGLEEQQGGGVEKAQNSPDDKLSVLEANESNEGLA